MATRTGSPDRPGSRWTPAATSTVADKGNNRVLEFPSTCDSTGCSPSVVYGKTSLPAAIPTQPTSSAAPAPAPSNSAPGAPANAPPDWNSVLHANTDGRISMANCSRPDPDGDAAATVCVPLPAGFLTDTGYAAIDRVTYGDLVGDGGTEALIPIDTGGSIGDAALLIYRLQPESGIPALQAIAPGGAYIDGGQLVALRRDPNSNCLSSDCVSGMVRITYKLVAGTLEQTGACAYTPDPSDPRKPQGECTPNSGS